jgi:hypothetical protein
MVDGWLSQAMHHGYLAKKPEHNRGCAHYVVSVRVDKHSEPSKSISKPDRSEQEILKRYRMISFF